MLHARAIHAALAGRWPDILSRLGIDPEFLCNRHGPCPVCGGVDRFRFDDREGRGSWICNRCGAGDAFKLLQLANSWDFTTARRRVIEAAGLNGALASSVDPPRSRPRRSAPTSPPRRVERLLAQSTTPDLVSDVVAYLESRYLWPLPEGCSLRAHDEVAYWDRDSNGNAARLGRYPAMIAQVLGISGELVTAHVTYLSRGRKLETRAPRKLLSKLTGHRGCAVRLMPSADVLGIGEGIETMLAAHALHGVPCWAALNTSLLRKFAPPLGVRRLIVFADRDEPGIEAARELVDRLRGRMTLEIKTPLAPANDWADVLADQKGRS
jgi:putative DNA primase/helicase